MKISHVFLLLLLGVCELGYCFTGRELAEKIYNRYDGDDSYCKIQMVLVDKFSRQRKRLLNIYTKDFHGLNRTYIVFLKPEDIAGTAFLSIENKGDKDETQYLYLPDLGRVRRIVSSQKSRRFVNTDYTYEDMERRKPNEDIHKIIGEKTYLGRSCYILESKPVKANKSQYSKRISLVDKSSYLVLAVDFYGKNGEKIKEFRSEEIKLVDGIWTIMRSTMFDLKRNHKTIMVVENVKYNQGLPDRMFTVRYLSQEH